MTGSPYSPPVPHGTVSARASTSTQEPTSTSPRSATSSTAGNKRKRGEPKFYSVQVGHKPGIYYTWTDCLEQVRGFKKATFKSFTSLADAEAFLSGRDPSHDPSSQSFGLQKFYGVRNGRVPGVYTDWPSAQKQITGWTKPKHRCFPSRAEAEAFVKGQDFDDAKEGAELDEFEADEARPAHRRQTSASTISAPILSRPPEKKIKKTKTAHRENGIETSARQLMPSPREIQERLGFEPGRGPLPPYTEDGFDPDVFLNPRTGQVEYKAQGQREQWVKQPQGLKPAGVLRIYTDGSSLGNGQYGAVSGVGVYFGDNDDRNVSEALAGPRQTNQRAELTAVYRALDIAPRHREVCIFTDSQYSINCITVWCTNWRKNNWKTSTGRPVENKDLIEEIIHKIEERDRLGVKTSFQWVKGHAADPGNVAADQLAVNGARHARA